MFSVPISTGANPAFHPSWLGGLVADLPVIDNTLTCPVAGHFKFYGPNAH